MAQILLQPTQMYAIILQTLLINKLQLLTHSAIVVIILTAKQVFTTLTQDIMIQKLAGLSTLMTSQFLTSQMLLSMALTFMLTASITQSMKLMKMGILFGGFL